ncbi:MarR family winged helix-turn-helix transcriptional regulator [Nocardia sp. 2YAB30]|uniref:MarR family winged helix-turn-helix transcriptional regulator n=1 Tax=unclassified Nocardia TaxID=2637762 RepID=UPI003F9D289F
MARAHEFDERLEAPDLTARGPDDDVPGEEPVGLAVAALIDPQAVAGDQVGKFGAVGAHKDHFVVLAALAEFGPASQAALSGRTRIYKSDLVSVLNDLEDRGWVRRAPDPADKRRNVITITDDGESHLTELDRVLDGVLDGVNEHIMAPLGRDERAQLFDLLGRINAHLASAQDRA